MAINLLPWREPILRKKQRLFLVFFLSSLMLTCALLVIRQLKAHQKKQKLQQYHQSLSQTIKIAQASKQQQEALFIQNQQRQEKQIHILKIAQKQKKIVLFLKKLGDMTYTDIHLKELLFENNQARIKGVSTSILMIFNFMQSLQRSPEVAQVHLVNTNKLPEGNEFHLTVDLLLQ